MDLRKAIIAAACGWAGTAGAAEPVTTSEIVSIETAAYTVTAGGQPVRIEVRSGAGAPAVALVNGTPFAVTLDRGGGESAVAPPLGGAGLPCSADLAQEPYRLTIDAGTALREQWITAACGQLVQLIAAEGLPAMLEVAP